MFNLPDLRNYVIRRILKPRGTDILFMGIILVFWKFCRYGKIFTEPLQQIFKVIFFMFQKLKMNLGEIGIFLRFSNHWTFEWEGTILLTTMMTGKDHRSNLWLFTYFWMEINSHLFLLHKIEAAIISIHCCHSCWRTRFGCARHLLAHDGCLRTTFVYVWTLLTY